MYQMAGDDTACREAARRAAELNPKDAQVRELAGLESVI